MDLAVLILAILFLCGFNVGKALAICSIIYIVLDIIIKVSKKLIQLKGEQ